MYGRHIIYTKLKGSIYYDVSPCFSYDVYVIPSTSITHPTTLAMIYVLHPPSWLPPSFPILLYLHPTQRKEEEDFFMATFLFQPHLQFFFSCKPSFSIFLHFTFQTPSFSVSISHREATGSCNIYAFYLSLLFHLLDNFR